MNANATPVRSALHVATCEAIRPAAATLRALGMEGRCRVSDREGTVVVKVVVVATQGGSLARDQIRATREVAAALEAAGLVVERSGDSVRVQGWRKARAA